MYIHVYNIWISVCACVITISKVLVGSAHCHFCSGRMISYEFTELPVFLFWSLCDSGCCPRNFTACPVSALCCARGEVLSHFFADLMSSFLLSVDLVLLHMFNVLQSEQSISYRLGFPLGMYCYNTWYVLSGCFNNVTENIALILWEIFKTPFCLNKMDDGQNLLTS